MSQYYQYIEIASILVAILLTLIALVISYKYTVRSMQKGFKGKTKPASESMSSLTKSEDDEDETIDESSESVASRDPPMDPLEFCEHIHGEVKRVQNKVTTRKIEEKMTAEQIQEERLTQRQQLESIFNMMKDQTDKFGVDSMSDVKQQMKLYA